MVGSCRTVIGSRGRDDLIRSGGPVRPHQAAKLARRADGDQAWRVRPPAGSWSPRRALALALLSWLPSTEARAAEPLQYQVEAAEGGEVLRVDARVTAGTGGTLVIDPAVA